MFLQGPMLEEGGSGKSSQSVFLPQGRCFFLLLLFNCFCRAVMACIQLILAYLMFELISLVGLLRSYKFLKHLTMKPRLNFFVSCLKVGDLSLG